jgi:hypothetical protein
MSSVAGAVLAVVVVLVCLIIVLAVTLMIVGYARGMQYWNRFQNVKFPRRLMSDVYPTLKTGDIALFIASAHGFTNSMLSQEVFSHAGMVVEIDGRLYLSESTQGTMVAPGVKSKNGSDLVPLLTRLKNYSGQMFFMQLSEPLDENTARRLASAARVRHPYPKLLHLIKGALFGDQSARHCFQHIGFLLDEANIASDAGSFSGHGYIGVCKSIIGLPGERLRVGRVRYDPPFEAVYDIGVKKNGEPSEG